jgi:hypothetical protein
VNCKRQSQDCTGDTVDNKVGVINVYDVGSWGWEQSIPWVGGVWETRKSTGMSQCRTTADSKGMEPAVNPVVKTLP